MTNGRRRASMRDRLAAGIAGLLVIAGIPVLTASAATAAGPCDPPVNRIACENSKPGTPRSEWNVSGAGDDTIQGFATDMSVNLGETIRFKIKTNASAYSIDIYRAGYYAGNGARKVATISPSVPLPQNQPNCQIDNDLGLVDCGNWGESASWPVPSSAVSGIYFALLKRADTGGESHIWFVVRDDASTSDMLFQTSDTTWQAYNRYGGFSLYTGANARGRAVKVSYNRPFTTADYKGEDWVLNAEVPTVSFLEANGYDVTYTSGVDSDRRGALIRNHKVFLSVGHDEYWSGAQRQAVEAARDAGVNLAFLSGNEVYWKTRWEPSIAGGSTPHRTLVTYKESRDNAKTDPSASWTGTWRDVRFSPPSDGGKPENALTGTIWTVERGTYAIKVPADDGKMRFWRNTSVATLPAGQTATLAENTLGYEWNEDLDNGSRPRGLIRLSTTTENVPSRIYDSYGNETGPGPATHHLTLYRAPSGSLVFGAGTVQWAYGLSEPGAGDIRMQQASVNLFADMGVQPTTLASGLIATSKSADTVGPSVTIASPAAGATIAHGAPLTVSGTAADTGSGVVGGVEVSVDGGTTWHPATGRSSWSYTTTAVGSGSVAIQVRASDDSANVGAAASRNITVNCPCSVFSTTQTPANPSVSDGGSIELGMRFRPSIDGYVTGVRFHKGAGNTGVHTGSLWSNTGTQLATVTFTGESATGWQEASFDQPVAVSAGATFVVSYHAPNGHYSADGNVWENAGSTGRPLAAIRNGLDGPNGVFLYSSGASFPTQGFNATNYYVDAVFSASVGPDTFPPTVVSRSPESGATGVDTATTVSATFSENVQSGTSTFSLRDATNNAVAGSVSTSGKVVTFAPTAVTNTGTTYTASISGTKDVAGNAMVGEATWSFTTTGPRTCPCSIWDPSAVPATASASDSGSINLGVRFRPDVNGYIYGIRFYKGPNNTGTHIGSLYTNTGSLLARATFFNESTTGWQQALFDTPVAVTAGTTYVASYLAPNGRYAVNLDAFVSAGAGTPPVRALQDGVDGANGVYTYSSSPTFPTTTFRSSNYWTDVVFDAAPPPPDTTLPAVQAVSPADGSVDVPVTAAVTATFNESVQSSTISFTLTTSAGTPVPGGFVYDPTSRTARFQATAGLVAGTAYIATVGGAKDQSGNTMASPRTWSFSTAAPVCPCSAFGNATPGTASAADSSAVELGVRFTADRNGYVTGVRFYKGPGNTGTHTGSVWSTSGTRLATATFTGETATGWQTVTFPSGVLVTAGTTYIASYHAPVGRYAVDVGYFSGSAVHNSPLHLPANSTSAPNGLYRYGTSAFPNSSYNASNYWVDPVFATTGTSDATPPQVTSTTPAAGATGVSPSSNVTATFNESIMPTTGTFRLTGSGGAQITAATTYNDATRTWTLDPTADLVTGTTYTATVTAVEDVVGNVLTPPVSWSFTVGAAACPCTIFPPTAVPATTSVTDSSAIELGVKFRADTNGLITGIRFYKGPANGGTHTGSLWDTTGTRLATVTFTGETATGWQEATLAQPVAVTAGTTYIASYHAPQGRYAANGGYFASGGTGTAPVRALGNGVEGGNGIYRYGASAYPNQSFNSTNYWVDVVFVPS